MSRRIFRDVEEAIFREVRRITFDDNRTVNLTVLQDQYDVFTGELVKTAIEPSFYDSSADTNSIQYPHFFVKLLYTREDRFTGRVIPQYGKEIQTPLAGSPQGYNIVLNIGDGTIAAPGNIITTTNFQIRKIQVGNWIRISTGNNVGTYIISAVTPSNSGAHTITVSSILIQNLPSAYFDIVTNSLFFTTPVDLSTIQPGDIYTDSVGNSFNVISISRYNNSIVLANGIVPSLLANGKITRSGSVFKSADTSLVAAVVLDQTSPVVRPRYTQLQDMTDQQVALNSVAISPAVPIDAYYLVRIDSKERDSHIDVANRVWEEFNPPRTGLPTIIRSVLSAEQLLVADIPSGGSQIVIVADNSLFNINDPVFLIDNFHPTKNPDGSFDTPFKSTVIQKIGTNQLVLADLVPDIFSVSSLTRVVSNASFYLLMFHFVDHKTKDVEGAQYWSHDFTFWVQFWIDRQGTPTELTDVVQKIDPSIESLIDNTVIFP